MMYSRRNLGIAVGLAGVALLAACGSKTDALSKADFVEQGDAICEATDNELEPIFTRLWDNPEGFGFDDPETDDQAFALLGEVMNEAIPVRQLQVAGLRALAPPEEDQDLIDDLFDDLETALDDMGQMVDDAAADHDGARELLRSELNEEPLADVDRRAREYGFLVCGQDS
jgi:hypothetical protein